MTAPDEPPAEDPSVLSSLPGTRPQRRSPKRDATPTAPPRARRTPRSPRTSQPPPAAEPPAASPTAAQGYESNPIEGSVNPPTGAELLASLAHAATELVDVGISLARRLARTAVDRLPHLK